MIFEVMVLACEREMEWEQGGEFLGRLERDILEGIA